MKRNSKFQFVKKKLSRKLDSKFQGLRSFFEPKIIDSWLSVVADITYTISLDKGILRIDSPTAVQSYGSRYHAFSVPFKATELQDCSVESVLLLGFGMGGILDVLKKMRIQPKRIVAIDIESAFFRIYSNYHPNPFPINMICSDAWEWVNTFASEYKSAFDLICVDVYVDQEPILPKQDSIIQKLMSMKSEEGRVYWSFPAEDPECIRIANYFSEMPVKIEAPSNDVLVIE